MKLKMKRLVEGSYRRVPCRSGRQNAYKHKYFQVGENNVLGGAGL